MKARLALLHYTAAPVTGGVESVMSAQARKLREAGYDVRVIAGRGDAELIPELDSRHPDVQEATQRLLAGKTSRHQFKALRDRVRDHLRRTLADRDLLIAHNVMTMPFNLPLAAALVELGVPLIAWTHDVAWLNAQYQSFRRPEWPYRIMAQRQPGVTYVTISRLRQRELATTFGLHTSAIEVVPNGIDPYEFVHLGERPYELLQAAGALDADPLLLVPQRVAPAKRLELVLDAAHELRPSMPNLKVVVTGPLGAHNLDDQAYATRLLEQRARLGLDGAVAFMCEYSRHGSDHAVRSEDVAALYRISDVVLMSSGAEGFGLPVIEAAVARVPLVCADIPILHEVGGDDLFTFPTEGSGHDVAAAIRRALASGAVRQRRFVLGRYAWPHVLASTERVISNTLDEPVLMAQ
ncbi:glycosyltransferase family 4 protein [Candidatus Nephthysia bennettiae]|uniref:Glycosyltransferase family 4 protein n=1 Tax=Candidatus Nephthysia bennettiae TaxID=3127016 RepID=A0A934NCH7_9BACT|nr:glycosyltransferase family 4 protein [Candidatus Dormibacteraeota bacterium]MBJ7611682.1 glycosyltransferase family 4 protein [Candidatus Dormibacteraeota bacterium]